MFVCINIHTVTGTYSLWLENHFHQVRKRVCAHVAADGPAFRLYFPVGRHRHRRCSVPVTHGPVNRQKDRCLEIHFKNLFLILWGFCQSFRRLTPGRCRFFFLFWRLETRSIACSFSPYNNNRVFFNGENVPNPARAKFSPFLSAKSAFAVNYRRSTIAGPINIVMITMWSLRNIIPKHQVCVKTVNRSIWLFRYTFIWKLIGWTHHEIWS